MTFFKPGRHAAQRLVARAALLLAAGFATQAQAFIKGVDSTLRPSGDTELVFMAWDNNTQDLPKVAFVKDLGVSMDAFFVSAQQDAGGQNYWYLGGTGTGIEGDAAWTAFLNTDVSAGVKVDPTKVRWAVFALDGDIVSPSFVSDDYKLFTTVKQATSGSATVITGLSNVTTAQLDRASIAMGTFLAGQNSQPGHTGAANENGSSVVIATQGDAIFPFSNGTTPNIGLGFDLKFNGAINASAGNLVGQSSWFYKVSLARDEFDTSLPAVIDEFDNLGADGYWGLAAASDPARTGQYFLSYTIAAFVSPREQSSGLMYGNSFAHLSGVLSLSSSAGKGETVLDLATDFLRAFAKGRIQAAAADDERAFASSAGQGGALLGEGLSIATAVPEPAGWALFGSGLGTLAWVLRRRQRRG